MRHTLFTKTKGLIMKIFFFLIFGALGILNVSHANDVNGDGNVNINDVIAVINMVLDPDTATLEADCTAPEGVDIADVICVINIVLENGGGGSLSPADAARFLNQATFGPTLEEINALVASGSREAWLDSQLAMAPTHLSPKLETLWLNSCPGNGSGGYYTSKDQVIDRSLPEELRAAAWWDAVLNGNDQLRQRVAFALTEIFVVSSIGPNYQRSFGLADYYDVLLDNAFGNYRDLLKDVTLHPMMGVYLSMLRNEQADEARNIRPDENYAREILQLFSIGVYQLNLDGSTINDANGNPLPSYNQEIIQEFAKVFTGWNYNNTGPSGDDDPNDDIYPWRIDVDNGVTTAPMIAWEDYHDNTHTKTLFNNLVLQPGRTAEQDLDDALDNIFDHPNVGPFISKRLIQRLTTSNPTPGYIARVAAVFNNSAGERGNLGAVVKAILMDTEAQTGTATVAHFGKLREPLLRLSHLRRSLGVRPVTKTGTFWAQEAPPGSEHYEIVDCGRPSYDIYRMNTSANTAFGQGYLQSPSVFNFFLPDYAPPGVTSDAALVAPEFQIVTENTMANLSNEIGFELFTTPNSAPNQGIVTIETADETALAGDLNALLDHLNLLLLNDRMSIGLRNIIMTHLTTSSFPSDDVARRTAQAKDAIMLIVSSPEYLIQK